MRIARIALLTAVAFAAAVSSAAATEGFCVADPACVGAGGTPEPDVQTALNAIKAGNASVPATLSIGTGAFTGPFSYFSPRPLTITGAGTHLQSSGDNTTVLTFGGNSADGVSGLSLDVTGGNAVTGLSLLSGASADHVDVTTPASSAPATGINITGHGTISKSSIEVGALDDNGDTSYGVLSGGGSVTDSTIAAPIAVGSDVNGSVFVVRDSLQATDTGVSCTQATCLVQDTLIEIATGGNGFGPYDALSAQCGSSSNATIDAANDTILGTMRYGAGAFGCVSAGRMTSISLDSSILMGATQSLHAEEPGGDLSSVTITPSYDEYDGTYGQLPPNALIVGGQGPGWVDKDPMCITRDCGIGWSSPAVDAGNPAPLGLLESTTDLAGKPRVVNGRRDIGAFEYQRTAPVIDKLQQDRTTAGVGQTVTFDGSAAGDPDRDPITYAWRADDGATGTAVTFAHAFTTPGKHTVTLTVTDTTGLSASATATVIVTGSGQPKPTVTGLKQSAARWRLGRALARLARKRKPPVGTAFTFKLNTAATVSFVFSHAARCGRHRKRCTVTDGTLTFSGHSGPDKVSFDGRLAGARRLGPGRYAVAVTAANAAGHSPTARLRFTIVAR